MGNTTTVPAMIRFREVCALLGMSTDAGYNHVHNGTFPIALVKVGSIYKARRRDVDAFIAGDLPTDND
jgi:predicted DNA-binding transcriptional regulator AlpA